MTLALAVDPLLHVCTCTCACAVCCAQSLACNTALSQGSQIIALLEERGEGIQWDNMDQKVLYTELTFDWMLAFMIFDGIIYGLIGWYASNVFPRELWCPDLQLFFHHLDTTPVLIY